MSELSVCGNAAQCQTTLTACFCWFLKACDVICIHVLFSIVLADLVVVVQWDHHLVVLRCSMIWVMEDMVDMDICMMEEWRSKYF